MDESIGIYIHVPFCRSKCFYCDFNSYSGKDKLAGSYFDALFSEIKERSRIIGERTVRTIFIGGGTPSYVEPYYISELLDVCSRCFKIDTGAEISMESNPGTLNIDKLMLYRKAGINRLSIGLQAWQDRLLSLIGRIHTKQQYIENFEAAVEAGFDNINTDLIFGLPAQSLEDWQETLENVVRLGKGKGLRHLSCYSLQIEEGTEFGRRFDDGSLKPADDDLDRSMYRYAVDFLADNGYKQYEISNFAEPGFECRHNLIYWKAREYAGFGAGAHSYLNKMRFSDPIDIMEYISWVNDNDDIANKHKKRVNSNTCIENCSTDGGKGNHKSIICSADNNVRTGQEKLSARKPSGEAEYIGNKENVARKSSGEAEYTVNNESADRKPSGEVEYIGNKENVARKPSGEAEYIGNKENVARKPSGEVEYIGNKENVARKPSGEVEYTANNKNAAWMPSGEVEYIGNREAMSEYMILGLRLTEGISSSEFTDRFGLSLQTVYGNKLEKLMGEGLIEVSPETKELAGLVHNESDQDSVAGFAQSNQDSEVSFVHNESDQDSVDDFAQSNQDSEVSLVHNESDQDSVDGFAQNNQDSEAGLVHNESIQDGVGCCRRYKLTRIGLDLANRAFMEFI